jgi:CPA2 family monovalent cation:H+ antiporter-2
MFTAPYMVSLAFPLTDRIMALILGKPSAANLQRQSDKVEPSQKVLLVGLGPAGQEVVRHLHLHQMTPIVIDTNPQSRSKAYELHTKIYLGDATNEEILLHAGFSKVCMAVVTVPDPMTTIQIVKHMRRLRPQLPIAARCRYHRHQAAVKEAGATIMVDEETQVGHDLAHQIVDFMQKTSGETLVCRLVGRPVEEMSAPKSMDAEA